MTSKIGAHAKFVSLKGYIQKKECALSHKFRLRSRDENWSFCHLDKAWSICQQLFVRPNTMTIIARTSMVILAGFLEASLLLKSFSGKSYRNSCISGFSSFPPINDVAVTALSYVWASWITNQPLLAYWCIECIERTNGDMKSALSFW